MVKSYPFRAALIAALYCLLGQSPAVWAISHPYGQDFIRFGHQKIDAAPLLSQAPNAPDAETDGTEQEFLQRVADVEQQSGPYAGALSESLYDLGRYYIAARDSDRALATFRRALHVVRINDGLDSTAQIPLLRATLDTYRMSGDFEGLDDRYDYYYGLLKGGQPPHTDMQMRAALAFLRWQREAIRLEVDRSPTRRIYNLLRLNNSFIDMLATQQGELLRWFTPFVLSQLKNLYLLQQFIEPRVEVVESSRFPSSLPPSRMDDDPIGSSLQRQRSSAFRVGTTLLLEALRMLPADAPVQEHARLQLALGDWYVWNDSGSRAGRYYAMVIEKLTEEGRTDLLHQWLGEPVELPDNGVYFQPAFGQAMEESEAITLRFGVTQAGRASNIALAAAPLPEHEATARRLMRRLSSVRFRPRWQQGYAEPVSQVQRRYLWLK